MIKVKHTFVKKGELLRFYTHGKYQYSIPVEHAMQMAEAVFRTIRGHGVHHVEILEVDEKVDPDEANEIFKKNGRG